MGMVTPPRPKSQEDLDIERIKREEKTRYKKLDSLLKESLINKLKKLWKK